MEYSNTLLNGHDENGLDSIYPMQVILSSKKEDKKLQIQLRNLTVIEFNKNN